MKVFCLFDSKFDMFLKQVVLYLEQRYHDKIDFTDIDEIELINKSRFKENIDADFCQDFVQKRCKRFKLNNKKGQETFL